MKPAESRAIFSLYYLSMTVIAAVCQRTRPHRSRGSLSSDSGRGDLQSAPWGRRHEAVLLVSADCTAVPRYACRQVALGCPVRPRSRRQSSGRCDLRSGHQPSIPDDLARCSHCVAPHNGSRCHSSSLVGDATCQSGLLMTAGRGVLPNSGR